MPGSSRNHRLMHVGECESSKWWNEMKKDCEKQTQKGKQTNGRTNGRNHFFTFRLIDSTCAQRENQKKKYIPFSVSLSLPSVFVFRSFTVLAVLAHWMQEQRKKCGHGSTVVGKQRGWVVRIAPSTLPDNVQHVEPFDHLHSWRARVIEIFQRETKDEHISGSPRFGGGWTNPDILSFMVRYCVRVCSCSDAGGNQRQPHYPKWNAIVLNSSNDPNPATNLFSVLLLCFSFWIRVAIANIFQ